MQTSTSPPVLSQPSAVTSCDGPLQNPFLSMSWSLGNGQVKPSQPLATAFEQNLVEALPAANNTASKPPIKRTLKVIGEVHHKPASVHVHFDERGPSIFKYSACIISPQQLFMSKLKFWVWSQDTSMYERFCGHPLRGHSKNELARLSPTTANSDFVKHVPTQPEAAGLEHTVPTLRAFGEMVLRSLKVSVCEVVMGQILLHIMLIVCLACERR